ncbi:hypothetical protein [Escherichia phage phi456]|uniref:Uncharacterized protein n=1 Tax=Escherichia phage phi456 TaxID=3075925 RepID=A0AA96IYE3_9CAUD|nr:hypothetical protein [Escherichia phage phi456]
MTGHTGFAVSTRISRIRHFFDSESAAVSSSVAIPASTASYRQAISKSA